MAALLVSAALAFLSTLDEARLLLAREPLSAQELAAIAATDDVFAIEILEPALERRLTLRRRFEGAPVPPLLQDEIETALMGIERLEPERAAHWAVSVACRPGFPAREVLARSGEPAVIGRALLQYFEAPDQWGKVLGEAARDQADPRLSDFLAMAGPAPQETSPRLFASRLERNLAQSVSSPALLALGQERNELLGARILSRVNADSAAVSTRLAVLAATARDPRARLQALAGLGRRRARDATQVLRSALADDDPVLAAVACRALAEIGGTSLGRHLDSSREPLTTELVAAIVAQGGREEARRLAALERSWSLPATVTLLDALGENDGAEAGRLLRGLDDERDRLRAVRFLAEKDRVLLLEASVTESEANALALFFARSSFFSVRELVLQATGEARGPALAALLLSSQATLAEKEGAARELGDAWWVAVAEGGPRALEELNRLALRSPELAPEERLSSVVERLPDPRAIAALAILPGARARQALLDARQPEAIEALMRRRDRALAIAGLALLGREARGELQAAAERALVSLSAPGSAALIQTKLGSPEMLRPLLPVLASVPAAREALAALADAPDPAPELTAAFFDFYQKDPRGFLPLLGAKGVAALERYYAILALAGDRARLPVLLEEAANAPTASRRAMAFRALAEADLEGFASRLHRLAGHADRRVRFETAIALAPSGEPWAIRLLAAELDESDERQVRRAWGALARGPAGAVRPLLEDLVSEGTATAFSILFLLDLWAGEPSLPPRALRIRAWQVLAPQVEKNPLALLAASRLSVPPAVRSVLGRLRALP